MSSWASLELHRADLGDPRRNRRLATLVQALADQPSTSVPQACGSWAATKAAYRFWDNDHVQADAILAAHRAATVDRARAEPLVLAIQDTTEFNLSGHRATTGLGYLDNAHAQGLKVHSVLLTSGQGVPLGVLHQHVWRRDPAQRGKAQRRKQRPLPDKESRRWLDALAATERALPEGPDVLTVADQEADIFDLFAAPRRPGSDLLIRVCRSNRCVAEPAHYLGDAIAQSPPQGTHRVRLCRTEERSARWATLTVRLGPVTLLPPVHHPRRTQLQPLPVWAILAEEEQPPPGEEPVRWLLLTTRPVRALAEAVQHLDWYTKRWRIERYHFVLKSGCRLEELALETADRMKKALATYTIVAWRLLWLTYEARQDPDQSADRVLETAAWQALWCTTHRSATPPATPPSLGEAVRQIAHLGGFLGRKSDGAPGVKVLWRGLRRLDDITQTWKLLHAVHSDSDSS